jgi:trehalose 6-phosphate synthase
MGLTVSLLCALTTGFILVSRSQGEQEVGYEDLARRSAVLAHRVMPIARQLIVTGQGSESLDDRLSGHGRLLGLAVVSREGEVVASGKGVSAIGLAILAVSRDAVQSGRQAERVLREDTSTTHVLATPVWREDAEAGGEGALSLGSVVVLHDAIYLEQRLTRAYLFAALWSFGVLLVVFLVTTGMAWALFERPLLLLAGWMRRLRFANTSERPPSGLPVAALADETVHLAASFRAARVKEREQASDLVRGDRLWTSERLRAHALDSLGGKPLVVVSNREPYMHQLREGKPTLVRPASGLVTGLDPVLRACGGLWVAHGAGDADRQTADRRGCIAVPPEDPRYTLRRVWISKEEEQGYYYGFSNEGLWPLCHLTHERPVFRAGDWEQYQRANQRFADAVLDEIGNEPAVVLVQDYQLALVPGMIKSRRPDLSVGLFWHIPWPNPETFRICPFREPLLRGMLGADVVGFHLRQHCNNFLDTVDRMVEARLDWDRFSAELQGHTALVRPYPISVQPWHERGVKQGLDLENQQLQLREQHMLTGQHIAVGVDRIDYTKGLAERFRAIERFFERHPEHRGSWTFVQLGAPSRMHIPRYRDMVSELETMVDAINWKLQTETWKPIRFLVGHHEPAMVYAFFRLAEMCIVSSLHDGMNLVAKEYVAACAEAMAQSEGQSAVMHRGEGVLILSEFAGAAHDLPEALIVNPYDTDGFADAMERAATMSAKERRQRMVRMRLRIEENNIYRWAGDLLSGVAEARGSFAPRA